jgi:hypothetical protein
MNVISSVVELAREAKDLRERVEDFETQMENLVGKTVTYTVQHSNRKRKFYVCTVDSWNGDSWELTDDKTGEAFEVTFDDFTQGRMWVQE